MKIREQINKLVQVGSYNIHRCIGMDGLIHPERIAEVIKELGVDILGLQEVDCCFHTPDGGNQLDFLARHTALQVVGGPTLISDNGHYGNGLLTRFDIESIRQIDLSMPKREPRGALDVDLNCHGNIVRVIVTHLGLGRAERKAQVAKLLDMVKVKHDRPTILLGDLNEWIPRASSMRSLKACFHGTPSMRTFPSRLPVLHLDRIFVWPHEAFIKAKVHISRLARIASDHLPIKGFIMLK